MTAGEDPPDTVGCQPDCLNRECGDDGCGGSCGACGRNTACNGGGLCVSEDEIPGPGEDVFLPGEDTWAGVEPRSQGEPWATPGDPAACPEGQGLMYGKCVPVAVDIDIDGGTKGGCGVGGFAGAHWWILLMVFVLATRKNSSRVRSP